MSLSETIPVIMNISSGEQCVLVNSASSHLTVKTHFNKEELGILIARLQDTYDKMK